MTKPLENSPYSCPFKRLSIMGAWSVDPNSEVKTRIYSMYKSLMSFVSFAAVLFLFADLFEVFGDIQKTTWNLCITALILGGLAKFFLVFFNHPTVNDLRQRLHDDAESRTVSQHLVINDLALKEFKFLKFTLYSGCCIFIPIWLISRYLTSYRDTRELPLPMRFPFEFDKNDDLQYNLMYVFVGMTGTFGLYFIVQCELCMFSIIIQISREYWILMKDIALLGDVDSEKTDEKENSIRDVNPFLQNRKIKDYLKYIYSRQQTLIHYTKIFESCYSTSMIFHFLTVSTVLTVVGIQLILIPLEFSGYVSFQLGYTSIILFDYFLICWFATRLKDLCYKVGEVGYDTVWYKMDLDIQKDLTMLIMRSQRPPRVTTGKLMEVNLNAFMHALRSIYSWLTLFRELEFKAN